MRSIERVMVVCLVVVLLAGLVPGTMAARRKKPEINVIYMAQAAYQPEEVKAMARLFTEMTGIRVNIDFVKYDEQHEKVVASAIAPVATYDVFSLDLIWTAGFAEKGLCIPLDDKIAPLKEDIPPAILEAFTYKGKIWAMPFLANFQLFFYNMNMIKRAGFSAPPKTLEEMVAQMREMKKRGIVKYPWTDSWNQKEGLVCEYVWLTAAFGGDLFDNQGKPVFNEGPGLKALEFMVMLLDERLANPKALTNDEPAAKDDFIAGHAAFTSNWTFQYGLMNDPGVSKVVGAGKMGLLPVSKSAFGKYPNDTVSVSGFQGAAIMSNSRHKEEAWKYIRFITSPIVQRAYLVEMPIWKSVQESVYAKTMDPTMGVKSKEIASVHHRPKTPEYTEVSSILQRYIHRALEMKMKPAKKEIEAISKR